MKKLFLALVIVFLTVAVAGGQWVPFNTGQPYSLFGVDYKPDTDIGVAVGQGGTIMKTTNGGVNWYMTYQNLTIWLNDVKFQNSNPLNGLVWAAGLHGIILRSTDLGDTWTVVRDSSDVLHTIRGIATFGGDNAYFVGYAGTMFLTNSGGLLVPIFTQINQIPWTMHSIDLQPSFVGGPTDRGLIVGTDGLAWRTTNGGANWVSSPTGRFDYLNDVVFLSTHEAIACGNNGTLLFTNMNMGNFWTLIDMSSVTIEHFRSIDMHFDGLTWKITVCGDHGKVLTCSTFPGPFTFIDQLNADGRNLFGVSLKSQTTATAVGEVGQGALGAALLTSFSNGSVGISQIGTTVPSKFDLSQNYPNPFNPSTKINFSLPFKSPVKLLVYDITGKQVASLVDDVLNGGNYSYEFNANGLASGVYMYQLITNDFIQTKKMNLIK